MTEEKHGRCPDCQTRFILGENSLQKYCNRCFNRIKILWLRWLYEADVAEEKERLAKLAEEKGNDA